MTSSFTVRKWCLKLINLGEKSTLHKVIMVTVYFLFKSQIGFQLLLCSDLHCSALVLIGYISQASLSAGFRLGSAKGKEHRRVGLGQRRSQLVHPPPLCLTQPLQLWLPTQPQTVERFPTTTCNVFLNGSLRSEDLLTLLSLVSDIIGCPFINYLWIFLLLKGIVLVKNRQTSEITKEQF